MITLEQNSNLSWILTDLSNSNNNRVLPQFGIDKYPEGIKLIAIDGSLLMNIRSVDVQSITDSQGTTTAIAGDTNLLFNTLAANFFFRVTGGLSSAGLTYVGEFSNYTDLTTSIPAGTPTRMAYVVGAEGTKWLPGSIGGSYYGTGWYYDTGSDWVNKNDAIFEGLQLTTANNRIIVNQGNVATTLGGVIDSTKEYFLDGIIDLGTIEITVPPAGIFIRGYNFDLSGLTTSEDNHTMFKSETALIGSGDVLFFDFYIETLGTSSKVYDLYDATGFNAIEVNRVNYNNCTSLGDLHEYRQGLETGTGRFGGSPSLTLHGTWLGGFRISTSIVRSMSDTTTAPLFCSGTAFVMTSRFLTDMNVDLGTLQPFFDFSDTNFPNPSTLELRDVILIRDGVTVPTDSNLTPNISASNLSCSWKGNNGIPNTFVGAIATITTEVLTGVTGGLPFVLLGTVTTSDLQHFDMPSNGQLRHLGSNPKEFTVNFDFILDGGANDEYKIELVKNDGSPSIVYQQTRVINNLQGGRDVAYFTGLANVILNQNDYIFWQVTNITDNTDCTLELGSSWSVEER